MSQDSGGNEYSAKFKAATNLLQGGVVEKATEQQRWRMYGLSKQVTEGDCNTPSPPSTEMKKKWKWEAWNACKGYTKDAAMMAFVKEVENLDPEFKARNEGRAPSTASHSLSDARGGSNGGRHTSISSNGSNKEMKKSSAIDEKNSPSSSPQPPSSSSSSSPVRSTSNSKPSPSTPLNQITQASSGPLPTPVPGGRNNQQIGVTMEGILFKERDFVKGWRPRHFILQGELLHYFIEHDDIDPKKTMDVVGCKIERVKPIKVGDTEYFPFIVSHPKATKTYKLAAASDSDCDAWITAITSAASRESIIAKATAPESRLLPAVPQSGDQDTSIVSPLADTEVVNLPATLEKIPQKYMLKVESAVETLVRSLSSTEGWDLLYEKKTLTAYKKSNSSGGSSVCVRGDMHLPFSILDIFTMIENPKNALKRDPQMHVVEKKKIFSVHTGVQYLRAKQVWPTAVRDFCNLAHWRLLGDGTIIFVSFSEPFDDVCPLVDGHVRGELIIGGYILKPTDTGTQCQYLVQSDLKGSIPSSIVNMVSSKQPMVLMNINDALVKEKRPVVKKGLVTGVKKFSYDDFYASCLDESGLGSMSVNYNKTPSKSSTSSSSSSSPSDIPHGDENEKSAAAAPTSTDTSGANSKEKSSSVEATDVDTKKSKEKKDKKKVTPPFYVLLFPVLLYYISPSEYRAFVFIAGFAMAMRYMLRQQLGEAKMPVTSNMGQVASGRMVIRFPVDLSKLLRYLDSKRDETGVDVTFTHLAIKAAAVAINETPTLNGHMLFGSFYKSKSRGIDVSVSIESPSKETVMMKIVDAEVKPPEYIADEFRERGKAMVNNTTSNGSGDLLSKRRAKIINS